MMTNSTIYEGDCLEVLTQLPSASIDFSLTDLPYGLTQNKWDAVITLEPMWRELLRVCKPTAAMAFFAGQPFTSTLVMSNPSLFRYEWIWEKNKATGFLNSRRRPLVAHESILIFASSAFTYHPQKTTGHRPVNSYVKHTSDGSNYGQTVIGISGGGSTERYPRSVVRFSVVNNDGTNGGRFHPTQKPVELLRYLICTYSNAGDTVLDFTCGSGSTGIACIMEDRNFIGIDNNAEYVAIARRRIEESRERRERERVTT